MFVIHKSSVMAGGGLAVTQPSGISAICQSGGYDSACTDECHYSNFAYSLFGIMAQCCFCDVSLVLNLSAFLYIELRLMLNYISIPMMFNIFELYCSRRLGSLVAVHCVP